MKSILAILLLPLLCFSQVTLKYDGITNVAPGREFYLSIKAGQQMHVGAITLYLDYPSDNLTVLDVQMQIGGSMLYNVIGDTLAIGWFGPPFFDLTEGDTILTLKLISDYTGPMAFTLRPYCDFGDMQFNSFPAIISMNTMDCTTGIDNPSKQKQGGSVYYNMKGQKTNPNGVYIINGRKYIKLN